MNTIRSETKEAYDAWHANLEVDASAEAPWHQLLKPLLKNLGGKRVLEIACGRGGLATWLAELPVEFRPNEIVASDFSSVAVEMAEQFGRSRGLKNITYRVEDITRIRCNDSSFDTVISCETIEHVTEPKIALRELARVLRPGGELYLTCPSYLNLMGLYRLYLPITGRKFTEVGQPVNNPLILAQVRRWVRQLGLRIEKTMGAGHYVPFPRHSPIRISWLDYLGPLSIWHALHTLIAARKPLNAISSRRSVDTTC